MGAESPNEPFVVRPLPKTLPTLQDHREARRLYYQLQEYFDHNDSLLAEFKRLVTPNGEADEATLEQAIRRFLREDLSSGTVHALAAYFSQRGLKAVDLAGHSAVKVRSYMCPPRPTLLTGPCPELAAAGFGRGLRRAVGPDGQSPGAAPAHLRGFLPSREQKALL